MKSMPLQLGIGIIVLFGLVLLGMGLYEPLWFKYHTWKMQTARGAELKNVLKDVLAHGRKGRELVEEYFENYDTGWSKPSRGFVSRITPSTVISRKSGIMTVRLEFINISLKTRRLPGIYRLTFRKRFLYRPKGPETNSYGIAGFRAGYRSACILKPGDSSGSGITINVYDKLTRVISEKHPYRTLEDGSITGPNLVEKNTRWVSFSATHDLGRSLFYPDDCESFTVVFEADLSIVDEKEKITLKPNPVTFNFKW